MIRNCRHSFYAFIPGYSVPTYTEEQLREMEEQDKRTRTWNGKQYNTYEATQKQRQMETTMRAQREKITLLKRGGADQTDIEAAQTRYLTSLRRYRKFSERMELPEQMERVYMDGLGRVLPGRKPAKSTKHLQEQLSYVYNGEKQFIPSRSVFKNTKVIAGNGSKTELRVSGKLAEKYGGVPGDWSKYAGKIESDKYIFDVHWYEKKDGKQYEVKLKARGDKP